LQPKDELPKWEKEFKKGFSKPLVLLTLGKEPHYPYQIIKTISKATDGKFIIAGSNIYPLLKTLSDKGFITGREDVKSEKKYYSLTEDGNDFLVLLEESIMEFLNMVRELIKTQGTLKKL
jgi:DNA-binding PadR family transcriptional regulator